MLDQPQGQQHPDPGDIVSSYAEAARATLAPLVIIEGLNSYVPGTGPVHVDELAKGHSNAAFLITRDDVRWVLRRPPRPPWPPTAHDVLREAEVVSTLHRLGLPVPRVITACADTSIIGAPFNLMEHVDGVVVRDRFPRELDTPDHAAEAGRSLAQVLADIHAAEWRGTPLERIGRPGGYLKRQLHRWHQVWSHNATREVTDIEAVGRWLTDHQPTSRAVTVVHGDYKLDNVIFARDSTREIVAVLDWEMAALGDPLADLGFTSAVYVEPGETADPLLGFSPATSVPGALTRHELIEAYAKRSGRDVEALHWYQCLAIWKIAIILEGGYKRFLAGNTSDPLFALAADGVPRLAARARALADP